MNEDERPAALGRNAAGARPSLRVPLRPGDTPTVDDDIFDDFSDDRRPGSVIGSTSNSGHRRLGQDREDGLSIDDGGLRIRYLLDPGWGRAGIAYGPLRDGPGLCLAVHLLDGLTTSQTPATPEGRRERIARWVRTFPYVTRRRPELHDNLAVGLFSSVTPQLPSRDGVGVLVGAGPGEEGVIKVCGGGRSAIVVPSAQNVPIVVLCIRRESDTVVYASSVAGARGFAPPPWMRPLAIVPGGTSPSVFAGVHQAVLGEVRYRVDTRVYEVRTARLPELSGWATAHVADRFRVSQDMSGPAARGGSWIVTSGVFEPGVDGLTVRGEQGRALLTAEVPSGLVHMTFRAGGPASAVSLLWRGGDDGSAWELTVGAGGAMLATVGPGARVVARDPRSRLTGGRVQALSVLDDGDRIGAYLDGEQLFDGMVCDGRLAQQTAVGFGQSGGNGAAVHVQAFEAHPRAVPLPAELDLRAAPVPDPGEAVVDIVRDGFDGPAGELSGAAGGAGWKRVMGVGVIERTGGGRARVRADVGCPNPGRTIYAVDWTDPSFIDVSVNVTPPGRARGEGHQARGGLALWQDADNHFVVNNFLDDTSVGVSISAFLRVRGHERMYDYDATWSNVGGRIRPGVPYWLRIVCDGIRFLAYVDGELVLYRAFTDYRADAPLLSILAVGLVANWEWGDDTGTLFDDFVARGRSPTSYPL